MNRNKALKRINGEHSHMVEVIVWCIAAVVCAWVLAVGLSRI